MGQHQARVKGALDKLDPVWAQIRREAEELARNEPELATFIYASVLHHGRLEASGGHGIPERLNHPDVSGELIRQAYAEAVEDDATIRAAMRADIVAVVDRDP